MQLVKIALSEEPHATCVSKRNSRRSFILCKFFEQQDKAEFGLTIKKNRSASKGSIRFSSEAETNY